MARLALPSLPAYTGSLIPFPQCRIKTQFTGKAEYLPQMDAAAKRLVADRFG